MSARCRTLLAVGLLFGTSASSQLVAQSAGGQPTRFPPGRMPPTTSARPPVGSPAGPTPIGPPPRPSAGANLGVRGTSQDLDSAIVEKGEVRVLISPLRNVFRTNLRGKPGAVSWRLDVNDGSGWALVLAADTLMRSNNVVRLVNGSRLRLCQNPREASARQCADSIKASVRSRVDFVQFTLRDSAAVDFFKKTRPSYIYGTSFEPNGKFRIQTIPVAYHDGVRPVRE